MADIFEFKRKGNPPAPTDAHGGGSGGISAVIGLEAVTRADADGQAAMDATTITFPGAGIGRSGYGASHQGYPDAIGIPLNPIKDQKMIPPRPSVSDTAAEQVVKTLLFYAKQGQDHGVMAAQALRGMETAIAAEAAKR